MHTVVDGPQGFDNSVPAVWEVTHPDYALVRLHGRNAGTWNIKGATGGVGSLQLRLRRRRAGRAGAEHAAACARARATTHVVFNNNMEDQGQRNAGTLRRLLDQLALS